MTRRKKFEPIFFTVEGVGAFPYDMLRYDYAWPVSEHDDVPKLAVDWSSNNGLKKRRVRLMSREANTPTVDRWRSFGWAVIDSAASVYQLTSNEIEQLEKSYANRSIV